MDKIFDYLKQLDLSDIEAKLYLTLLKTGPISVRDLAETIDIKRTTAYFYIDQLVDKGLAIKMVKGSKKQIAANEPESLKYLVDKKVESAKIAASQYDDIISQLSNDLPEAKDITKAEIRYYKGKTGVKKVYEEALLCDSVRLYVNLVELERLILPTNFGLDYNMFDRALQNNPKLKIYEIVADEPGTIEQFNLDQTSQSKRYFYKFMPQDVGLTAPGILLYEGNVAIINGTDTPHVVVLHNSDYFVNSQKLFDFIWKTLPEATGNGAQKTP